MFPKDDVDVDVADDDPEEEDDDATVVGIEPASSLSLSEILIRR
eukprot:CAMPEP_0171033986 /NCGR_PEP_ID=MMETSP0736-20130129/39437_1 /TAXON_ID=186038 /ORGANISM="Fragilariopsis kerguelensis, Strain L26-C5" /LENGTH=43 /DNA_ID= /DNA_START= /DNA_END= /DNA_ORIENTATION=